MTILIPITNAQIGLSQLTTYLKIILYTIVICIPCFGKHQIKPVQRKSEKFKSNKTNKYGCELKVPDFPGKLLVF